MSRAVDRALTALRKSRGQSLGTCAVCRREVTEREHLMTLRGGLTVHRACASYSGRATRDAPPG